MPGLFQVPMGLLQFGPESKEQLPARRSLGTSYVNIAPTTTAYLSPSLLKAREWSYLAVLNSWGLRRNFSECSSDGEFSQNRAWVSTRVIYDQANPSPILLGLYLIVWTQEGQSRPWGWPVPKSLMSTFLLQKAATKGLGKYSKAVLASHSKLWVSPTSSTPEFRGGLVPSPGVWVCFQNSCSSLWRLKPTGISPAGRGYWGSW